MGRYRDFFTKFTELTKPQQCQLFGYSCAARTAAIMFSYLMMDAFPGQYELSKLLAVLDISIYPEIWIQRGEVSDPVKASVFLSKFSKEEVDSVSSKINFYFLLKDEHVYLMVADDGEFFLHNPDGFSRNIPAKEALQIIRHGSDGYTVHHWTCNVRFDFEKIKTACDSYFVNLQQALEEKYLFAPEESMISPPVSILFDLCSDRSWLIEKIIKYPEFFLREVDDFRMVIQHVSDEQRISFREVFVNSEILLSRLRFEEMFEIYQLLTEDAERVLGPGFFSVSCVRETEATAAMIGKKVGLTAPN